MKHSREVEEVIKKMRDELEKIKENNIKRHGLEDKWMSAYRVGLTEAIDRMDWEVDPEATGKFIG